MTSYGSRPQVPSDSSCDSLDISKIVSGTSSEDILGTSITFLSTTDSLYSLSGSPSFPSTSRRPLFINLTASRTLANRSSPGVAHADEPSDVVISVPTGPRMRSILMEPIAVNHWAESLPDKYISQQQPWQTTSQEHEMPRTPWLPSGSLFPPELFRVMFRTKRSPHSEPWTLVVTGEPERRDSTASVNSHNSNDAQPPVPVVVIHEQGPYRLQSPGELNDGGAAMEGGAVPTIMLSNSTMAVPISLESSQSLAPVPIAVRRGRCGPPTLPLPAIPATGSDLYPGIPTPFLGSPSTYNPTFVLSEEASDISMDLDAMCRDLRSRCPPLSPSTPVLLTQIGCAPDALGEADADSEEWDFARQLLDQHLEPSAETPLKSTHDVPEAVQDSLQSPDPQTDPESISWSTDQTLTNSPQPDDQSGFDLASDVSPAKTSCAELPKQQRRRTVIIETPRNSVAGATRPVRMTVDLSHLAHTDDVDAQDLVNEVPLVKKEELVTPVTPAIGSTPVSRPISSASVGRPVRSILKTREKKSVRFSELPSMHEYPSETRELESVFEADEQDTNDKPRGRKRAATTPAPRKAPLDSTPSIRTSFPKHPGLRSLVRTRESSSPSGDVDTRRHSPLVPRLVDKKDVGRPKRLTGTPSPRASLPADRRDSSVLRKQRSLDENSWRRSAAADGQSPDRPASVPRSRMPFKSILTRFRS